VIPLLVLWAALKVFRSWKVRAVAAAVAAALAAPNLLTLGIVLGTGNAAHAGDRILDVGCGVGTAEVSLGQIGISQLKLFGVDLIASRVRQAYDAARVHNIRAGFAAGDARQLPFADQTFDSTYCVAVLQHVRDLAGAVAELARVTKPGGRVLVVEPDNAARYWYSSVSAGAAAFAIAARFFRAAEVRDGTELAVGPRASAMCTAHRVEPTAIRLFPVSLARLGSPAPAIWQARREIVHGTIERLDDESLRKMGADYLRVLDRYEQEAEAAGTNFVEIQSTMLFATVGRKSVA
jgi:SAM-dependent methyltransferase